MVTQGCGCEDKQGKIEPKVLAPAEPAEDPAAAARHFGEKMYQDGADIEGKDGEERQPGIEPDKSGAVKQQARGRRDLERREDEDEKRNQGTGNGLVVQGMGEAFQVEELAATGIDK